jgi:hypothetical protein
VAAIPQSRSATESRGFMKALPESVYSSTRSRAYYTRAVIGSVGWALTNIVEVEGATC